MGDNLIKLVILPRLSLLFIVIFLFSHMQHIEESVMILKHTFLFIYIYLKNGWAFDLCSLRFFYLVWCELFITYMLNAYFVNSIQKTARCVKKKLFVRVASNPAKFLQINEKYIFIFGRWKERKPARNDWSINAEAMLIQRRLANYFWLQNKDSECKK